MLFVYPEFLSFLSINSQESQGNCFNSVLFNFQGTLVSLARQLIYYITSSSPCQALFLFFFKKFFGAFFQPNRPDNQIRFVVPYPSPFCLPLSKSACLLYHDIRALSTLFLKKFCLKTGSFFKASIVHFDNRHKIQLFRHNI